MACWSGLRGGGEAVGQRAEVLGEFGWGFDLEVDVEQADHERGQGEGVGGEFELAGVLVDGGDDPVDVAGDLRGGAVQCDAAAVM